NLPHTATMTVRPCDARLRKGLECLDRGLKCLGRRRVDCAEAGLWPSLVRSPLRPRGFAIAPSLRIWKCKGGRRAFRFGGCRLHTGAFHLVSRERTKAEPKQEKTAIG